MNDRKISYKKNDETIYKLVMVDPGLNVSQIAKKVGLQRRIVRKHLYSMYEGGLVDRRGTGYFSVGPISDELHELVRKTLDNNFLEDWNFPSPHNVAACYVLSEPDRSHNRFRYLFDPLVERFFEDRFWINDILAYAISWRHMKGGVFSKGVNPKLNLRLLKKGWRACFGDSKLFVIAFAISPPQFLDFLTTPAGEKWLTRYLESNWDSILERVERQRSESAALAPKLRRLKKLGKLADQKIKEYERTGGM